MCTAQHFAQLRTNKTVYSLKWDLTKKTFGFRDDLCKGV